MNEAGCIRLEKGKEEIKLVANGVMVKAFITWNGGAKPRTKVTEFPNKPIQDAIVYYLAQGFNYARGIIPPDGIMPGKEFAWF